MHKRQTFIGRLKIAAPRRYGRLQGENDANKTTKTNGNQMHMTSAGRKTAAIEDKSPKPTQQKLWNVHKNDTTGDVLSFSSHPHSKSLHNSETINARKASKINEQIKY